MQKTNGSGIIENKVINDHAIIGACCDSCLLKGMRPVVKLNICGVVGVVEPFVTARKL